MGTNTMRRKKWKLEDSSDRVRQEGKDSGKLWGESVVRLSPGRRRECERS